MNETMTVEQLLETWNDLRRWVWAIERSSMKTEELDERDFYFHWRSELTGFLPADHDLMEENFEADDAEKNWLWHK